MTVAIGFPSLYVQGKGEIKNIGKHAANLGNRFMFILNTDIYEMLKDQLEENKKHGIVIDYGIFSGECTYAEMDRMAELAKSNGDEVIVGIGGGKALDTAKGTAFKSGLPLVTVPTSAAQDAPCLKDAVVYREDHTYDSFMMIPNHPALVLVDSQVVADAPARFIAAGIADGLSTTFEANAVKAINADNCAGGKATLTGIMMADNCYDILMKNGLMAYTSVQNNVVTDALEKVIEANILLSGVGCEAAGDSVAHSIFNACTGIPQCKGKMHGELVNFGTLVQTVVENDDRRLREIAAFTVQMGLPVCLEDIGISRDDKETIMKMAQLAVEDCAANEPFDVTAEDVYAAIMVADSIGSQYKCAE